MEPNDGCGVRTLSIVWIVNRTDLGLEGQLFPRWIMWIAKLYWWPTLSTISFAQQQQIGLIMVWAKQPVMSVTLQIPVCESDASAYWFYMPQLRLGIDSEPVHTEHTLHIFHEKRRWWWQYFWTGSMNWAGSWDGCGNGLVTHFSNSPAFISCPICINSTGLGIGSELMMHVQLWDLIDSPRIVPRVEDDG